ncbi:hypothetical protein J2Z28_006345 [Paenibacillus xylanexedens]|uniref:Uncharacterized protein n=1 Tax=Paenibacillus xylanexedens TaxID=528191 RepID=A0ABS4S3E2_PAEXY|nr:hypothetical protein [Paenibacillus xylanexedens]
MLLASFVLELIGFHTGMWHSLIDKVQSKNATC